MNKYKIYVARNNVEFNNPHFCYGKNQDDAMVRWMFQHPNVRIISIELIGPVENSQKQSKKRTSDQLRSHHKARITQMRNNAQSLMEDEDSILTIEERLQLSRITCQFDRILALWTERSLNLKGYF